MIIGLPLSQAGTENDFKAAVRAATTSSGTLASAFAAGQTVDGVTLVAGDRLLLKDQSTAAENGIYVVNSSGAPSRADDLPPGAGAAGVVVVVSEGTVNADTLWACTTNPGSDVIGTNNLAFAFLAKIATPTDGQILIGSSSGLPAWAAITGTSNQVTVTLGANTITLSLPQNIHTGASPTFAGLTLSGLTASRVVKTTAGSALTTGAVDLASTNEVTGTLPIANGGTNSAAALNSNRIMVSAAGAIVEAAALTNGQLLIGSTGAAPVAAAITATANQTTVSNGAGTITIGTVQSIGTGSSPTFTGLTLSGLTASRVVKTNGSSALTTGAVNLASTNEVTGTLPIGNGGTNSAAALNSNRIMVSSSGAIVEAAALTNGQLLIGSTSAAPVAAALTGTSNQITVTNGAGSITLSTPQDIGTSSTPTFGTLILTSITTNRIVMRAGTGELVHCPALTNGQVLIGNTGGAPTAGSLTGTSNQITVTNGGGSITLSTPQDIGTSSTPTFAGIIGGSAAGSSLTLKATSGVGAGSEYVRVTAGNNGATEVARFGHTGFTYGLGINTSSPTAPLHVVNTSNSQRTANFIGDGVGCNVGFERYSADASPATFIGIKGRGTVASKGQTLSGDQIMAFAARGITDAAATTSNLAELRFLAGDNFTSANQGSYFEFYTVPTGSTTQTKALTVDTDGGLKLATAAYLQFVQRTTNPTDPSSAGPGNVYVKGSKLIAQYNDSGTVRYKYLDLTGTGSTWTHTTIAP